MKPVLFLTTALFAAGPLAAQAPVADPLAPALSPPPVALPAAPPVPTIVIPKDWRGVFDAIDGGNWTSAQAGIGVLPASLLTPVAKAELFTAKGSPAVDVTALTALIAQAPELPHAAQLTRMAQSRGATEPLAYFPERRTISLGSAPVRYRARPVSGEPPADELRAALDPLIKINDAAAAEVQLLTFAPLISAEARAEAGQRVAFGFYVLG
ncbi:MAG: lytic transglycosylase domain-containing protein, partial [Sphingomicrobium sp.]